MNRRAAVLTLSALLFAPGCIGATEQFTRTNFDGIEYPIILEFATSGPSGSVVFEVTAIRNVSTLVEYVYHQSPTEVDPLQFFLIEHDGAVRLPATLHRGFDFEQDHPTAAYASAGGIEFEGTPPSPMPPEKEHAIEVIPSAAVQAKLIIAWAGLAQEATMTFQWQEGTVVQTVHEGPARLIDLTDFEHATTVRTAAAVTTRGGAVEVQHDATLFVVKMVEPLLATGALQIFDESREQSLVLEGSYHSRRIIVTTSGETRLLLEVNGVENFMFYALAIPLSEGIVPDGIWSVRGEPAYG